MSLIEASAIEWSTAPRKRTWASHDDEELFSLGIVDVTLAVLAYLHAATLTVAHSWRARMPSWRHKTDDLVTEEAVLLTDSAPWLHQLTTEQGYKQVMDHSALKVQGGAFPVDHLFRALASSGMVQDSRVLLKRGSNVSGDSVDDTLDVVTVWQLGADVCGHAGIVHGGMTAAMIDESYGYLLYLAKATGVMDFPVVLTASLEVSYKQPLTPNRPVCVTSWISTREGRKIWVHAAVSDRPLLRPAPGEAPAAVEGDRVYATSKALFLVPRPEGSSTAVLQQAGKGRTDNLDAGRLAQV